MSDDYAYESLLDDHNLPESDLGVPVTLSITIDSRDLPYYLWVRDDQCVAQNVMRLEPGETVDLGGAWAGGYATLVPIDVGGPPEVDLGPVNPNVPWDSGASFERSGTTMSWSWS